MKFYQYCLVFYFLLKCSLGYSQKWITPANFPIHNDRYNDIFFIDEKEGWVVSGYGTLGYLMHSIDGGMSWDTIYKKEYSHFRTIYFFDSLNGVLSTVGTDVYPGGLDSIPLYFTQDGGRTFTPSVVNGSTVKGICNFYKRDDILFAAGRVGGGSFFCKSKDMGKSWFAKDLSNYLGTAIAINFKTYYNGFIFGGTSPIIAKSYPIILKTEDGGNNWDTVAIGQNQGGLVWKMQFPTDSIGYATVLDHKNKATFFKTNDAGNIWTAHPLFDDIYASKGIYFENEKQGFIGGDSKRNLLYTNDGGATWAIDNELGVSINRIIKTGKKYYAIGKTLWIFNDQ